MKTSKEVDKILPAVALVKASLKAVTKGAANPFFKSKYADLNTHLDAVEPLLEENKLMLLQPVSSSENGNLVESVILHPDSGQFISSSMTLVGDIDMQKAGSGVTYARRYTLGSLLSMKAQDDDGEAALNRKGAGKKTAAKSSAKPAKSDTFRPSAKSAPKGLVAPSTAAPEEDKW